MEEMKAPSDEEVVIALFDSLVLSCRGQAGAVISTLPQEDEENGGEAWLALLSKYEVHTRTRFVTIHHQLLNATLDMTNPDEYFHKIDLLRKQLSEVSTDRRLLSDEEMISFALYALPNEVAYLRSVLEANPNWTYEALKNYIRSHPEGTNRTQASEATALASRALLQANLSRRFRGTCCKCGQRGHKANQCRNGTTDSKKAQPCGNCGRHGHETKDCYSPGGMKHHAMSSTTANQAKPREYAFSTGTSSVSQDSGLWFVDSACTTHMTNELSDLSNIRGIGPIEVECGGGTTLKATQSGNVSIHTRDAAGNNIVVF